MGLYCCNFGLFVRDFDCFLYFVQKEEEVDSEIIGPE